MTIVNLEGHHRCELGDFYKTIKQDDQSWEFKAKGMLKEEELTKALHTLQMLKSGEIINRR